MRRLLAFSLIIFCIFMIMCKEKEKIPEPGYVLKKWTAALEKLDYTNYKKCEAYPRTSDVFMEMYKDEYFTDIMVTGIEDVDYEKIDKDYNHNSYISCSVTFEGTAVKREDNKPYQLIRGDVLFIQFIEGERKNDGWLISNRSIIRINR
ncbi:MAG: hypothetical protein JW864_07360 [Spirochaetes bacterium]|nr:hypothetical protein [Spirochaetota bacterium]